MSNFYLGQSTADAHAGFLDAASAVWPQIGTAIERCMQEKRPLFVTGHSLGAAIALATVDRAQGEKGLDTAQVFVFGAPRVGRASRGTTRVRADDVTPCSRKGYRAYSSAFRICGTKFDLTKLLSDPIQTSRAAKTGSSAVQQADYKIFLERRRQHRGLTR